jgi:hypothetical protein
MTVVKYNYYSKLRDAVLLGVIQHQPVTLLQLTKHLAPTYSFQTIKNELKRLIAESTVKRKRISQGESTTVKGFHYFIEEEKS